MMALIAPILKGAIEKIGIWRYLIGSAVVLCVYQFIVMNFWSGEGIIGNLMEAYPFSLIGYGMIYGMGIIVDKYKDSTYVLTGIVGIVALLSAFFNGFGSIQAAKYPPQIYYLSYGLFISLVLYIVVRKLKPYHRLITWVSKESLTIYFWHAFVLKTMGVMGISDFGNWVVRWIVVLVV